VFTPPTTSPTCFGSCSSVSKIKMLLCSECLWFEGGFV
jgi:hypothetical protein